MSVGDNSDFEESICDLDGLIEEALAAGPKAPDELFNSVMKKTRMNARTYYYHLKKLLRSHCVERVPGNDAEGRLIRKYALKASASAGATSLLVESSPVYEKVCPSRRYLEIAAWLRREPEDWPEFGAVRKAKLLENRYPHLIPVLEVSNEGPDCYAFVWSDEPCRGQQFGEFVQSRFFRLKDVFCGVVDAKETEFGVGCGDVFVGAYGSDVVAEQVADFGNMYTQIEQMHKPMELRVDESPFSVCVAVCRGANGVLRVVHVEGRSGKLDKAWVKGVSMQVGAKAEAMLSYGGLNEDVKRSALLKLRDALEKRKVEIPNRYVKLVEELVDYSYGNLSSGYVLALALAVNLALP